MQQPVPCAVPSVSSRNNASNLLFALEHCTQSCTYSRVFEFCSSVLYPIDAYQQIVAEAAFEDGKGAERLADAAVQTAAAAHRAAAAARADRQAAKVAEKTATKAAAEQRAAEKEANKAPKAAINEETADTTQSLYMDADAQMVRSRLCGCVA